jgi:hypothetical protein
MMEIMGELFLAPCMTFCIKYVVVGSNIFTSLCGKLRAERWLCIVEKAKDCLCKWAIYNAIAEVSSGN